MSLSFFQKPSRYIDSEFNAIKYHAGSSGDVRKTMRVRCALAFPDVYEVGMSHLGLRILYDLVNGLPHASAERVFSPWTDLEEHLKRSGLPLSSLESSTPLSVFDIVGFSLQYELSYTTVLNMLSLGGIPLRSAERLAVKGQMPLVVAGGPCTVNPMPMAPFIDAFLVGDGEEAVPELVDAVHQWKMSGDGRRESLLREIAQLSGFYVPSVHGKEARIGRRFIADLDTAPYPTRPVVPYTSIVHDRVTIEVSRGCTMGCRFCQAGMIYRPLRERSPGRVLEIAGASLRNTGYDEVSLTSLSAGDYCHLLPVTREFNRRFGASKIALSLPSLRVASLNPDVLREIRSIRNTGFTIAPEAATERLRSVINKDFTDDDYERALKALFEEGWLNLKMYFMIGLPTERDEDLEAIREMALKALRIAKKNTGRFVNIGITISPFVPKAHTPFQWYGQNTPGEMQRKLLYLKEVLSSKKFKFKGHNGEMSLLEGVFARGDEGLADLVEKAWELGCRLDGWSELFDFRRWTDAMERTGIDGPAYARKSFTRDEQLPWEPINIGVRKEFLYKEYERALAEERTPDCNRVCTACGLRCGGKDREGPVLKTGGAEPGVPEAAAPPDAYAVPQGSKHGAAIRVRCRFSKEGKLRYLSHLELSTTLIRGLRRAGIPFDFSKGFHPAPKISFGQPLGVGVAGEREYFDMEVFTPFDIEFHMRAVNSALPEGITVHKMSVIPVREPSLGSFITRYEYEVRGLELSEESTGLLPHRFSRPLSEPLPEPLIVQREGKDVDISPCIERVEQKTGQEGVSAVTLVLRETDAVKVRVGEIIGALFGADMRGLEITRKAVYGWRNGWVEPL
ncbi:MAG: TIGR03960 family B12-binding radical SAM protein [Alphaproteobacteria bacterium]|uniref:TIGR03960 family B12-binding radical SAM protein n=1 Tax=Candidatus Nitrobium versatile TaxID=2884831 RepID=A0A953J7Q2_9BACT|nr:TIGR03960 family B12-binding radical SAM protein [Candidatus Nitrobium versatile]